jgi:hypothetical protein
MSQQHQKQIKRAFEKGKLEQKKEDIKLINGFEPTKSNMMYDEVCLELIKQIKGKEKGK